MSEPILICTDLDRTLLPNGLQPESSGARALFRAVAGRPEVMLAYASGRSLELQIEAIREYDLPLPHFAIADVGTTIYRAGDGQWEPMEEWSREISPDWQGLDGRDLAALLGAPCPLRLQEPARQARHKLSYYAPTNYHPERFRAHLARTLAERGLAGLRTALTWSVDETRDLGLLDVIPQTATKLHALEFLIARLGLDAARCLYSGDSGNDLPVLASAVPSVLVRNAHEDVRREAVRLAREGNNAASLYLARGGLHGMNGNYAAGILEGLVHFHPEAARWLGQGG